MIPFIKNLLGEYGYEIVALPKADIKPLLLLCKEGEQLTSLNSDVELLFEEDIADFFLNTYHLNLLLVEKNPKFR